MTTEELTCILHETMPGVWSTKTHELMNQYKSELHLKPETNLQDFVDALKALFKSWGLATTFSLHVYHEKPMPEHTIIMIPFDKDVIKKLHMPPGAYAQTDVKITTPSGPNNAIAFCIYCGAGYEVEVSNISSSTCNDSECIKKHMIDLMKKARTINFVQKLKLIAPNYGPVWTLKCEYCREGKGLDIFLKTKERKALPIIGDPPSRNLDDYLILCESCAKKDIPKWRM